LSQQKKRQNYKKNTLTLWYFTRQVVPPTSAHTTCSV